MSSDLRVLTEEQLQKISPHIISLHDGNLTYEGPLSNSEEEVRRKILSEFREATKNWSAKRLVLYAHGGLVPETSGVNDIYEDYQNILDSECYPIAFIWHTGLLETLKDMLHDLKEKYEEEPSDWYVPGQIFDISDGWLEDKGRDLGSVIWSAMKDNALQATVEANGGAKLVARLVSDLIKEDSTIEIHMVGHSAGSILLAYLLDFMVRPLAGEGLGLTVSSCSLWAPACTMSLFDSTYLPALRTQKLKSLNLYTLSDAKEQSDNCAMIYRKSLLYLVSNSFEGDEAGRIPLLGMACVVEKHNEIADMIDKSLINWIKTGEPGSFQDCARHGDFPDWDNKVVGHTLELISADV